MSRDALLDFILDCFIMDPVNFEVSLSMINFHHRNADRQMLEYKFV